MVTSSNPSLPAVHIRIVCEQDSKGFPCDFCFKTFASERALACHVCTHHKSVDVQDVYVCSICRCCLLNKRDLYEHITVRHQLQIEGDINNNSSICEYCGIQVSNLENLMKHWESDHLSSFSDREYNAYNVTELTLSDISNISKSDQKCRTFFKVIEIPYSEIEFSHIDATTPQKDSNNAREAGIVEKSKENFQYLFTEKLNKHRTLSKSTNASCSNISKSTSTSSSDVSKSTSTSSSDIRGNVDTNKAKRVASGQVDSESKKQTCINAQNQKHRTSEIAVTVQCKNDEVTVPSAKGELILTVESEEKLTWSRDVMSEVLSSSGVLRRASLDGGHPSVVIEEVSNDSFAVDQPDHVSMKVSCEEEEEVIVQLYSNNDEDQGLNRHKPAATSVPDSATETNVLVNCIDNSGKSILDVKDVKGQKRLHKRKDCFMCGKIFSNLEELEKHEGSVHGVRVKCDLCSDTFAFSKSLRTHYLRKHSNAKGFPCKICGKLFKSRSNLWSHHLNHNDSARKYKCPQCPQRFHSLSKLKNHQQTHSGKKKYQCGECSKGFVFPSLLVNHMVKHFSEEEWNHLESESFYLVEVETEDPDGTNPSTSQP